MPYRRRQLQRQGQTCPAETKPVLCRRDGDKLFQAAKLVTRWGFSHHPDCPTLGRSHAEDPVLHVPLHTGAVRQVSRCRFCIDCFLQENHQIHLFGAADAPNFRWVSELLPAGLHQNMTPDGYIRQFLALFSSKFVYCGFEVKLSNCRGLFTKLAPLNIVGFSCLL